jgi:hypothetical protein
MGSKPFWNANAPATPDQLTYIRDLQQKQLVSDDDLLLLGDVAQLEDLTKGQASALIGLLRTKTVTHIERALELAKERRATA